MYSNFHCLTKGLEALGELFLTLLLPFLLLDTWSEILTQEKKSLLTLLDLSTAFDAIDHSIVVTRLEYTFAICNAALAWFKSHLYDLFQTMSVNSRQSEPVKLSCGIPQGSVLGPVLFTFYATPLAFIISRHNLNHHLYANDTQLLNSALPENSHFSENHIWLLLGHQWLVDTKQTSTKWWKDSSDARRNKKRKKKSSFFPSTPFSLTIPQSYSLTLSKASAFSSTAHCPWRASSAKQPNRAATSSVESVLSGSIFPMRRLQWNWPPHSFCHASTTAVLSFLVCLLPLSTAFVGKYFFPPRLQWNWSPRSFCHASTIKILSFLVCLLPLSIAFVGAAQIFVIQI